VLQGEEADARKRHLPALGCVLYEIFTGPARAFEGKSQIGVPSFPAISGKKNPSPIGASHPPHAGSPHPAALAWPRILLTACNPPTDAAPGSGLDRRLGERCRAETESAQTRFRNSGNPG